VTAFRYIGRSLARTEDTRLTRGLGRYVEDLAPPGHCRMVVVRSPHAAARIVAMDAAAAASRPGVLLVLTGDDPELLELGTFSSRVKRQAPGGGPNFEPPYRALSHGAARFVGDAVAAIFADTLEQAKNAAEALAITWEPGPSVTATDEAAREGAPIVWTEAPRNTCFLYETGDRNAVDAAMRSAAHVVSVRYPITRVHAAPMETRNALGSYDLIGERFTLYAGLQNPHYIREELAERVLRIRGNQLRVVSPDLGGAFGLKETPYPEHVLVLLGARRLGRTVLWTCDRSESFIADHHARDSVEEATLALDAEGRFLALRLESVANIGAYISYNGLHSSTNNLGGLSGVYTTPAIHAQVRGVFTHTPPTSPYRGAGRPEAIYAIERSIDLAAQRFGFDRIALRRRNMIPAARMPYETGFIYTYDSGEFERNMDEAMALASWATFEERRETARARGVLAGIGLANAIEIAAGPSGSPFTESAEIQFDSTGSVTVELGSHSHGQGHEITFAQIVADHLGLPIDDVRIRFGDTDRLQHGTGTFGSRSAVAGSVVLIKSAERIIERGKAIAAAHFEASAADIVFEEGIFSVAGTDRRIGISEVARLAFSLRPDALGGELGLGAKLIVAPRAPTFPNGCHVCEVEVDRDTGTCRIVQYCLVDDVGRRINPRLVEGQVHGGVVQGVGQILMEHVAFDQDGQILSGSFMDYAMPRASDLPNLINQSNEILATTNPLGVKGVGEVGMVGALAAVVNAVVDALRPLGVDHVDMPITPARLWRVMRDASVRS
jgi:carbon-monoxide dehydrogenase large subunit